MVLDKKISRIQFMFLMFWLIMGTGILTMPFGIAHFTVHDGWMVPAEFFMGSCVATLSAFLFTRAFPGCTLTEGFEQAFGPWIGRMTGIWLIIVLFVGQCMLTRELSLFLELTALPITPLYVNTALLVAPLAVTALLGIHTLARVSEFLTPIGMMLAFVITLLALSKLDLKELQPVLEHGWSPVYRAGLLPAAGFAFQFVIGVQFIKSLQKPDKLFQDTLIVAGFLSLLGTVTMVVVIGVLGPAVMYLQYPVLEVVRSIRIGEFLERFDTVYAMGAISTIIVKIGVWQYGWLTAIQHVTRVTNYRGFAIAASVSVWAGAIFFWRSSAELGEFMLYVTPSFFGLTFIALPLMAAFTQWVRNLITGGASQPVRSS